MPRSLPDIIYKREENTAVVDSESSVYEIPFHKSSSYFDNLSNWTNFVKGVEQLVRTDDRYNRYISYLKRECKLDHCQVLKDLNSEDCDIEMHHGPIFNLFEICAIVTEYFIQHKWKTTTFRVADQVLKDHHDNMIQVVMLSTTIHQEVHAGNVFINYHQAWGDMHAFVKKYNSAIGTEYRDKMNRYLDRCLLHDSTDYEILTLNRMLFEQH